MGQTPDVKHPMELIVFRLEGQSYALAPSSVERVIRIVNVTPFPDAPAYVTGVINLHGDVVPVVDLRRLFHLPVREVELTDQLVIARTGRFRVGLHVDEVAGFEMCSQKDVSLTDEIFPGSHAMSGVARLHGDIVFIYDLEGFLLAAGRALEGLMQGHEFMSEGPHDA